MLMLAAVVAAGAGAPYAERQIRTYVVLQYTQERETATCEVHHSNRMCCTLLLYRQKVGDVVVKTQKAKRPFSLRFSPSLGFVFDLPDARIRRCWSVVEYTTCYCVTG